MQTILNFLRALWMVDDERIRVHWRVWLAGVLVPFLLPILILFVVFDYLTRDFPDRPVRRVVLLFLTLVLSVIALFELLVVAAVHRMGEGVHRMRETSGWAASSPEDEERYFQRGCELGDEGRWREAIAQFDKTITMNPHHGNALAQRGFAYAELGEVNIAIADMEEALALTDDPDLIADLEAAIKELREGGASAR